MKDKQQPQGDLLLRTQTMPADTNPNGDIFGGWVLSQMDIAGSILAKEFTCGRVVTIAVEGMKFIEPIQVGDIFCCYGYVEKIGNTSITVKLEVWVKPILTEACGVERFKVTEARFVYVAIDDNHKKRQIPKK
ncbi:MAG: acyl-CoA thioester hydrolase YciA [Desulfobacter sp.]|jgi:acyl-CoA thioesterase YciA|uniref:acyl-CoA thioester hydrolase YciA n=1 Tax=uncultured Desulfobacter sp. TaxID=240139 RepID=UPI0029C6FA9C|nr:acyl-CoA thioester hydrolase YciA [uncultured Desulfobacter sp.]MCW8800367.1 acyl-CoA thioester hydrolase YciA [Desulfobacter sp.]